jgi:hypothetical protein
VTARQDNSQRLTQEERTRNRTGVSELVTERLEIVLWLDYLEYCVFCSFSSCVPLGFNILLEGSGCIIRAVGGGFGCGP